MINFSIRGSKSFDYKTNVTKGLQSSNTGKGVKIVVPIQIINI